MRNLRNFIVTGLVLSSALLFNNCTKGIEALQEGSSIDDGSGTPGTGTPTPTPTPGPPNMTDFPTAANTGIPAGKTLSSYSGTYYATVDNAVIDGLDITGNVVIEAKNVTLKNSRVRSGTPYHLIRVMDDATGFRLENCELIGNSTTVNGVLGVGTFIGNKITGFDNGLNIWGGHVEDNYIYLKAGTDGAHFDGIEMNAVNNVKIIHNTIIIDEPQTSAIMMNNYYGEVSNVLIENNYLSGGGYTIYLDGRFTSAVVDNATIKIINNVIGSGLYGYTALYGNNPTFTGNVDAVTKEPLN